MICFYPHKHWTGRPYLYLYDLIITILKSKTLLFQDIPKYDNWLKFIVGCMLALTLILGIIFIYTNIEIAYTLFGITVFDGLLFAVIIPRRYQIFEDRLRIQLGGTLAINMLLNDIREAKPASASEAFVYWGLRLATSTSNVIEIVRRKGLNVVISPNDRDIFVEQLEQARRLQPMQEKQ